MHESAHKMVLIFFVLIRPCLGASGFHGGDDCGVSTPIEVVEVIHDITDIKPCLIVLDAKSLNDVVQKNTYCEFKSDG